MKKLHLLIIIIAAVFAVFGVILAFVLVHGHSSGQSRAADLAQNAESLRMAASDKLSKATLAIDNLIEGATAGDALPVNQTKAAIAQASSDLSSASDDLSRRAAALNSAANPGLNDNFRHYLALQKSDNGKLQAAIIAAQQITQLLQNQEYSLAGWDQAQAQKAVAQVHSMEAGLDKTYGDAESLHNQADQLKRDHPGDFG